MDDACYPLSVVRVFGTSDFDSNSKIATQLLGIKMDGFGPEYVENRNAMIAAVTLDDTKRVAKSLLETQNLIVTIVGKPRLGAIAKKGKAQATALGRDALGGGLRIDAAPALCHLRPSLSTATWVRPPGRSFLSLSDQLVGKVLYLFGGQRSTRPIDTLSVRLDAKNSQGFSGTAKRGEH